MKGKVHTAMSGRAKLNRGFEALERRYVLSLSPLGGEFLIPPSSAGAQSNADVAIDADGDFVAVWSTTGGPEAGVWLRRFDAAGVPQGPDVLIDSAGSGPSVAMDQDGEFAVAWTHVEVGTDGYGLVEYSSVRLQRYAADGAAVGSTYVLQAMSDQLYDKDQWYVRSIVVDSDSVGNLALAWQGHYYSGGALESDDIGYATILANGSARVKPAAVSHFPGPYNFDPDVSISDNGEFAVSAHEFTTPWLQRFTLDLEPIGDWLYLDAGFPARIALSGNSEVLLFEDGGPEHVRLASDGSLLAPLSLPTSAAFADATYLANGDILVATNEDGECRVQIYDSGGHPLAMSVPILESAGGAPTDLHMATDGVDHVVFSWTSGEVFGRRFSIESPQLVANIEPGEGSSSPEWLTDVNGMLFFTATAAASGNELWKSDGTSGGTVLVADIEPGAGSSQPQWLTSVGAMLFFTAADPLSGTELWKSDGTPAGTVLVADILPGPGGSQPSYLTNSGGILYFRADDGSSGSELWKSDGTAAGTMRVHDILPGSSGSEPQFLTNANGTVFFRAHDGASGFELWKSDGTASGTVRVADIRPGASGSLPYWFTNLNGTLIFRANDGTSGDELWRSDGTAIGTARIADIRPGGLGSLPSQLTAVGENVFFQASNGPSGQELWKSDGTSAGTQLVRDISPGTGWSSPEWLINVGGALFFRASDGVADFELWKSDGTAAGTNLVRDIRPGNAPSGVGEVAHLGGILYFKANDGVHGYELWRSDGTIAGTYMVADLRAGAIGSYSWNMTRVGGALFFHADDGATGFELWRFGDLPPFADAGGPYMVDAGSSLMLDASDSFDRDGGPIMSHLWDINGDGVFGDAIGVMPTVPWADLLALGITGVPQQYDVRVQVIDSDGTIATSAATALTVINVAPRLASDPLTLAASTSPHSAYPVPTGSGEQLRTVPLGAVDTISLTFVEEVVIAINDLTLNGERAGAYSFSSFSYDSPTLTATWTLPIPIGADALTLVLADTVTDTSGVPLDGEWENPTDLNDPVSSANSGDGLPGGVFDFRFTVLPGDANRDNQVTGADYSVWSDNYGTLNATFEQGDFNGDGRLTPADYTIWADNYGIDLTDPDSTGANALPDGAPFRSLSQDIESPSTGVSSTLNAVLSPRRFELEEVPVAMRRVAEQPVSRRRLLWRENQLAAANDEALRAICSEAEHSSERHDTPYSGSTSILRAPDYRQQHNP